MRNGRFVARGCLCLVFAMGAASGCKERVVSIPRELKMNGGVEVRTGNWYRAGREGSAIRGNGEKMPVPAWFLSSSDGRGGKVEAVVAPVLGGRVLAFGRGGGGGSAVWTNPDFDKLVSRWGKDGGGADWLNFGGEKTWPWPQSRWGETWGGDWPPPKTFDAMTFTETSIVNGVRMVSRENRGVRCMREVTLTPTGALRVRTQFEAVGSDGPDLEVAAWTVMQLPFGEGDAEVEMRAISSASDLDDGKHSVVTWPGATRKGDSLVLPLRSGAKRKIGGEGEALVYRRGSLTMTGRVTDVGQGRSHAEERLQVYRGEVGPKATPADYVELEFTGLRRHLRSEGPAVLEVEWQINEP